jgi:hypothetical protein
MHKIARKRLKLSRILDTDEKQKIVGKYFPRHRSEHQEINYFSWHTEHDIVLYGTLSYRGTKTDVAIIATDRTIACTIDDVQYNGYYRDPENIRYAIYDLFGDVDLFFTWIPKK